MSAHPVCVQLCLDCRDVSTDRGFRLQLLVSKPQPVQELLQGHVQPLPGRHLWLQVGPRRQTRISIRSQHLHFLTPAQLALTSCWESCCAGRSSAGSCCPAVSAAARRPPCPPARLRFSARSRPESGRALRGCQSPPGGPVGNADAHRHVHLIFLVIVAAIFQEFTFLSAWVCRNGFGTWERDLLPKSCNHRDSAVTQVLMHAGWNLLLRWNVTLLYSWRRKLLTLTVLGPSVSSISENPLIRGPRESHVHEGNERESEHSLLGISTENTKSSANSQQGV